MSNSCEETFVDSTANKISMAFKTYTKGSTSSTYLVIPTYLVLF